MTSTQEAPAVASAAKVQEFTTDLVVHRRHAAADGVVALDLADPQGDDLPAWEPGAHVDLLLDEGLVRQYSLCGDPRDAKTWRVGVLLDPQSRGGSRHVHERLVEGGSVRVRGPRNHFALVDSPRYLFIAGGIGITPIIAMIDSAQQAGSDWTLIYLGRGRTTMAFADALADSYGDRVTLWPNDEKGQFDLEAALSEPADQTLVYCCGPEPLLSAVEQHCAHWPEGSLHIERFAAKAAAAEPTEGALDSFQVVCQRSGVTVEVSEDVSILEASGGRRHTDHVVVSGRNLRHLRGDRLGGHPRSSRLHADRSRTHLRQQDPHMCVPFPLREVGVGPMTANYPTKCWYVAATSDELGDAPLGRRLLGRDVVLWRTPDGQAVAFDDRCAHRGFPLSDGHVDGDRLVCGYHGCAYTADGRCVHVPTQPDVPTGMSVRAFPILEAPPFVWIWLGPPAAAVTSRPPRTPWLNDPEWSSFADTWRVEANYLMVHEHYLDFSYAPIVYRDDVPPGMEQLPAFNEVEVTETTVSYTRLLPRGTARRMGGRGNRAGCRRFIYPAGERDIRVACHACPTVGVGG